MRIDLISIFGDYFAPLSLSLVGRAISDGLLDVAVHDLRRWTSDPHRTVDDAPYGGGAGMVMRPDPWGRALDELVDDPDGVTVVFPTPSGHRFDQAWAQRLCTRRCLVFACGRYEGIDARVAQDTARRVDVAELSVGDYVLNGGEVAALAMVEAVVRLLPGVVGNPDSLVEESHADGLLEYPVYTRPPSWRGLDVPAVLLSGHHGRVAAWRQEQSVARTHAVRPDLLEASEEVVVSVATADDAGELLTLQHAAFLREARENGSTELPPLGESLADVLAALPDHLVLVARQRGRLIGSVRGWLDADGAWFVGRLMVAPDRQGEGLGSRLLAEIESRRPATASRLRLYTGARSMGNLRFYGRRGYSLTARRTDMGPVEVAVLEKDVPAVGAPG